MWRRPVPERHDATIDELDLDPENPRLPEGHEGRSQPALLETMARDYSLIELARSFVDNGYFQEEPLATLRHNGRLKVVEGNRRLAALRLLSDPALIEQLRLGSDWIELTEQWQERPIETVPVLIYESRAEITPFLGFRHISGVRRWEPRAKARFLNSLLEEGQWDFAEAARLVGSNRPTVRNNYVAYRILLQARDEFGFDTTRLESDFGVFLRALSSAPVKQHMAVEIGEAPPAELRRPVPPDRSEQLRELIAWIFGMDGEPPVIRESRDITKLGWVLSDPEALAVLRTSRDFNLALSYTRGEEESLLENLRKASYHLDEAKRDVDRHSESEEIRTWVQRCKQSVDSILALLRITETGS